MEFLNDLTSSLSSTVGGLLPGILGALLVLIIGLIIASIVRRLVLAVFRKTEIDEKIGQKMNVSFRIDKFIAKLAYYLVVLYVLLLVLDMMNIKSVLEPLQNMVNQFLTFIPNIIAAGIIGFAGYVIATIVSEASGLLAQGLERFSAKIGLQESFDLTKIIKQIVFVIIFLPILIVALDTLKLEAISKPATEMLSSLLAAIPRILAAGIILAVFFIVGKYVVAFLVELLKNLKADDLSGRLGISRVIGEQTSLSKLVGQVVFFFLMFAGVIAAIDKLEMSSISDILNTILELSGKIVFGLIILVIGNVVSEFAADMVAKADDDNDNAWLASIVRFATLGIFLAIALSTMGIADSIVNLAFGLTLGAVAVAVALSFGLGGREAAGKQMEYWLSRFRKND